jgi:hypothetical protein
MGARCQVCCVPIYCFRVGFANLLLLLISEPSASHFLLLYGLLISLETFRKDKGIVSARNDQRICGESTHLFFDVGTVHKS